MTNIGEDVEKREPLYSVVGNVYCYRHMENSIEVPQKLKIKPLYDPTASLLYILSKKTKALTQKHICTSMFIAALFVPVKT